MRRLGLLRLWLVVMHRGWLCWVVWWLMMRLRLLPLFEEGL